MQLRPVLYLYRETEDVMDINIEKFNIKYSHRVVIQWIVPIQSHGILDNPSKMCYLLNNSSNRCSPLWLQHVYVIVKQSQIQTQVNKLAHTQWYSTNKKASPSWSAYRWVHPTARCPAPDPSCRLAQARICNWKGRLPFVLILCLHIGAVLLRVFVSISLARSVLRVK